jgi:ATP-dependent DNA helicase RecQ
MSIYNEVLLQYWGYSSFRPLQEEIVESAGAGTDTLALMPTGGGKSITFQVPSLAKEGICLVITPLIALMKDQVENLKARNVKALAIHSGLTRDEINVALDNCVFGDFKFLYLSPERLNTELFKVRVQQMNVNLIAVDEAHCISQWGYDFRPSYLRIAELKKIIPNTPILALTATATPSVAQDIMEKLEFENGVLLKKSFERKNLVYVVRNTEDKHKEMLKIATKIDGSAVIYVRNRKKSREVAELLIHNGISADYYHAGLKFENRMQKQDNWQQNKTRIMVSTNAFGMGIDKPDVRFVIHMDLPDSPEAYFQEAGRAGRDEEKAWAILLYGPADERQVEKRIDINFPSFDILKDIYKALFSFLQIPIGGGKGSSHDFILGEFLSRYKYNALTVTSSLTILSREGYFEITDEMNNPSRIHFTIGRDDLYKFQVKNPAFDGFIKLLLRSYTGLFSQYVAFDEFTLSKRAQISRDEVYKYLVNLAGMKVISYIPKKKNPVVTFLEERLDDKNIFIARERYKFRKERYVERITELLEYAQSGSKCRSQFLLTYFGEKNVKRCGQCDVCLGKKGEEISKKEYLEISQGILKQLKNGPANIQNIQENLSIEEERLVFVLEIMMEDGKIKRGKDLKFYL